MFATTIISAVVVSLAAAAGPIVQTTSGAVMGVPAGPDGVAQFLGIPFAEPPIGKLRWQPPVPRAAWSGVRNATAFGAACPQLAEAPTSEDCLFVNAFVPTVNTSGPLSVMLWIHGGAYVNGSAASMVFNGAYLAATHGSIVFSLQYRLGALGFGGATLLQSISTDGSTGNFGLQDQRLAMKWVKANAAAFGGNPDNIFVWGESAGGGSVSAHLVAPRSAGLFASAGIESGPFAPWIAMNLSAAEGLLYSAFDSTSCRGQAGDALLSCVLALPAEEIVAAQDNHATWAPVVDGVEWLHHPRQLASKGQFSNRVPVLMGSNHDEGTSFVPLPVDATEAMAVAFIESFFAPVADLVLDMYPFANYASPFYAVATAFGDTAFSCPTRDSARWLTAAGIPTFVYFFTRVPTITPYPGCSGACHFSEVPFVFHFQYLLSGASELALSDAMGGYWASFAASHTPSGAVAWPQFNTTADAYLQLDTTVAVITGLKTRECDMWARLQ